jgi:plasmid stability protein
LKGNAAQYSIRINDQWRICFENTDLHLKRIEGDTMSNLQIKGLDDRLYSELKKRAADENRSVSQYVVYLIRNHLTKERRMKSTDTPAQALLSLAGSWEDSRTAAQIVSELKNARRASHKLRTSRIRFASVSLRF